MSRCQQIAPYWKISPTPSALQGLLAFTARADFFRSKNMPGIEYEGMAFLKWKFYMAFIIGLKTAAL